MPLLYINNNTATLNFPLSTLNFPKGTMTKKSRHAKIIEIINSHSVETQEELTEQLLKLDFEVTQATVSRDIKELGLTKIMSGENKYKYVLIESGGQRLADKHINLFREAVVSVARAENLIVVRCISGGGSSAGITVDKLNLKGVLGSVAGDDTLLIICQSGDFAANAEKYLKGLLT